MTFSFREGVYIKLAIASLANGNHVQVSAARTTMAELVGAEHLSKCDAVCSTHSLLYCSLCCGQVQI